MTRDNTRQKILLMLSAGAMLGFSRSPKSYFKVLKASKLDWESIDRQRLYRVVREFYNDRIVDYKEDNNGHVKIVLTKEGRRRVLKYKLDEIKIKKTGKWDGLWRVVLFDIPETKKKAREALRKKLRDLGFKELQKSVFICPFECEDEIDFVVEVFQIRPHVKFMQVKSFTNEEQMRIEFEL